MTSPEKMHPVGIIGGTGLTTLSGLEITGEKQVGTPWAVHRRRWWKGGLAISPLSSCRDMVIRTVFHPIR